MGEEDDKRQNDKTERSIIHWLMMWQSLDMHAHIGGFPISNRLNRALLSGPVKLWDPKVVLFKTTPIYCDFIKYF